MPFVKGQSGNPGGAWKDKPFRQALQLEIAAAGTDHKALRKIAKALLAKAGEGDVTAIKEVADRLDGKPTQAVEHSLPNERDPSELSGPELLADIDRTLAEIEGRTGRKGEGQDGPANVRKLN